MPFEPGHSGNPAGRKPGLPDKRTRLRNLLEPHAESLVHKCVQMALAGDVHALRLCLDRLIPRAKDEPIGIDIPVGDDAINYLNRFSNAVMKSVVEQELTPGQAIELFNVLKGYRDNIVIHELKAQLDEVRQMIAHNK